MRHHAVRKKCTAFNIRVQESTKNSSVEMGHISDEPVGVVVICTGSGNGIGAIDMVSGILSSNVVRT